MDDDVRVNPLALMAEFEPSVVAEAGSCRLVEHLDSQAMRTRFRFERLASSIDAMGRESKRWEPIQIEKDALEAVLAIMGIAPKCVCKASCGGFKWASIFS